MTVFQMRGLTTTVGVNLTYFDVPFTEAQVEAMMVPSNSLLIWVALVDYVDDPLYEQMRNPGLDVFKAMYERMRNGWHPKELFGNITASSIRFNRADGTGTSNPPFGWSVTAGPLTWNEYNYSGTVEALEWGGSTTQEVYYFGGSNARARYSPSPLNVSGGAGGTSAANHMTMLVHTSDDHMLQVPFHMQANVFGWTGIATRVADLRNIDSRFALPISELESVLLEEIDTEGGGDDVVRFNPRTQTSTVGCYIMNKDELRAFLSDLWTTDAIKAFQKSIYGDGADSILSLKWFYGIKEDIPTSTQYSFVTLGNVAFRDLPSQKVAIEEFVTHDFGMISVPRYFGDYRDYQCAYRAYLPFVGTVELDPQDVVGKSMYLSYTINLTDGSAICRLRNNSSQEGNDVFITNCSWGYDIPIRIDSVKDVASLALSLIPMGAAAAAGGGALGGPIGSALGLAATAVNLPTNQSTSYTAGSLNPNANVMGDFTAAIVAYHPTAIGGGVAAVGKPSNQTLTVGDASGFLKASVVYNAGSLPTRRTNEIIQLLQEGIYI